MKETLAYLNSLLKPNDTIIIGLSGGPDSMCLLDILLKLKTRVNIICAHINHNIREESKDEMMFITEYCQKKQLTLETTVFDKKSETEDYNELELREKRYKFFGELMNKYNAKYLLTAHHGDDLIETILMRISRGSNLKGYSGFQVEGNKNGIKVIKPLIFVTKEDIQKYNEENNVPFVNDYTNEKDDYTRNRYRHTILPFLKGENKNIHLKYIKFSRELKKYYDFVESLVEEEISKRYNNKVLDITNFSELDKLIQTKIIEFVLDDNYYDNLYLVNDKHVNLILDIINNSKPNIEINLPDNLYIQKQYNKVRIYRNKPQKIEYKQIITEETILPNNHTITIVEQSNLTNNYCTRINSQEIKLPLYVRTRNTGDKMIIKNMNNNKKIKDIFIDCKLTKDERETQPIVVDSNDNIIWLPGLKKSKFDKSIDENYDIILWYN